jgi:predicted nucleotide-binding protein (sugar kinase/HSP70/actin superfamily)
MPTGNGACRFDHYFTLQYSVINELGYDTVPIYAPNQSSSFYKDFKYINRGFEKILWDGIVAIDFIDKITRKIRPYELNQGETDRAYKWALKRLCDGIEKRENFYNLLTEISGHFKGIKTDSSRKRPVLGIIGEIFVRSHEFSNNDLIRNLEKFGAEVFVPPALTEWFLYLNYYIKRNLKLDKKYISLFSTYIKDLYQKSREHKIGKYFKGFGLDEETPVEEVINYSYRYIVPELEEEVGITIGKALDYINLGVSGIVNVMPFTCMPGNISTILLERIKSDYNNIPVLNLHYDGQKEGNTDARLETFVFQCSQFSGI